MCNHANPRNPRNQHNQYNQFGYASYAGYTGHFLRNFDVSICKIKALQPKVTLVMQGDMQVFSQLFAIRNHGLTDRS